MMTLVDIAGTGDVYTIVWRANNHAGDSWCVVMLCTLRDRRVWRATTYSPRSLTLQNGVLPGPNESPTPTRKVGDRQAEGGTTQRPERPVLTLI